MSLRGRDLTECSERCVCGGVRAWARMGVGVRACVRVVAVCHGCHVHSAGLRAGNN